MQPATGVKYLTSQACVSMQAFLHNRKTFRLLTRNSDISVYEYWVCISQFWLFSPKSEFLAIMTFSEIQFYSIIFNNMNYPARGLFFNINGNHPTCTQ